MHTVCTQLTEAIEYMRKDGGEIFIMKRRSLLIAKILKKKGIRTGIAAEAEGL